MAMNYVNIFQYRALRNLPKIGIFVLKRNHLAVWRIVFKKTFFKFRYIIGVWHVEMMNYLCLRCRSQSYNRRIYNYSTCVVVCSISEKMATKRSKLFAV
jgi:hypothetical protein